MAVTTVTTTMAAGVNYTVVTDTSADWPSVPNSTYFYDKADKLVHYKNGSGTVLEIFAAGGGGLTYFTEAQNTAAPNATVPVDSLKAVSAATNADFAIIPKAGGALLAAIPDNTFAGGNKRGQFALDLQMSRSSAVMVASGNFSAILGGINNTAIGANSLAAGSNNSVTGGGASVAIGQNNSSTNTNSYSFGNENLSNGVGSYSVGRLNNASGTSSLALGAGTLSYNTASGSRSVAIGDSNNASNTLCYAIGYGNTSNGFNSFAIGQSSLASGNQSFAIGLNADTQGIYGKYTYANGRFANNGDAQCSKIILRCLSTASTSIAFTNDGLSASTNNQVILTNMSAFRFKGSIVVKRPGSLDCAAWDIDGLIVRGANAGSTTLVSSNVSLVSNIPNYNAPTLTADTVNGGLRITSNGSPVPLQVLRWVATIETTEVIYF
jgi:hypothetical protein